MDKEKIFIMDLSKGRIGEDNSRLLGALLITKLQLAAMSRVDIPEEDRKDFYLYVDEFQNFATESFTNILSEARKYRLNITLGHQYIGQLSLDGTDKMRDAVFGNVGTLAVFRVGAEDAEFLEREFTPQFTAEDLVNLPKYNIYLKLMIDGVAGHPFSAETLPPPIPLEASNREKIIRASRERYGVKREVVEEKINRWAGFGEGETVVSSAAPVRAAEIIRPKIQQNSNFQQAGEVKLYDAICSNCGKATKVIFPPEEGRTVYCKSCLKKMRAEKDSKNQQENLNNEKAKIENVDFRSQKRPEHFTVTHENHSAQEKPHRKEINLSELKKVLEESLEKKDESNSSLRGGSQADAAIQGGSTSSGLPRSPAGLARNNEVKQKKDETKKIIKPGETVKL